MSSRRESRKVDLFLGHLLRVGVIIATTVVLIGGIFLIITHGEEIKDYTSFHGEPYSLRNIKAIVITAWQGESLAIVQLGVLLLITTPILRVVCCLLIFILKKDWLYIAVASLVLTVLLYSLLWQS